MSSTSKSECSNNTYKNFNTKIQNQMRNNNKKEKQNLETESMPLLYLTQKTLYVAYTFSSATFQSKLFCKLLFFSKLIYARISLT